MITDIRYDFSSLNEFLNTFETPSDILDDLAELALNYASMVNECNLETFKNDIGTIYVIYQEFKKLKQQETSSR